MTTSHSLGRALAGYVVDQLEILDRTHLPGLRLPGVFAGHPVGADVRADLAFTVALLADAGVVLIGGRTPHEVIVDALAPIDGEATTTFWSYRVAETLARFGSFAHNSVLDEVSDGQRAQLASACDSSASIGALDSGALPRNYGAVLARCELARWRLGLIDDTGPIDELVARTRTMFDANKLGFVDDSPARIGRYDIYTADLPLFTEGFAERLGEPWTRTAKAALELVSMVKARDGTAIPWGRSSGALAVCLTIELAALAVREQLVRNVGAWVADAEAALQSFDRWIDGGLISAHRGRSTYGYRGINRWLQMTFDCLGKLAWSAGALLSVREVDAERRRDGPLDVWIAFDDENHGAWAYRSTQARFMLPVVGSTRSDYLPALHQPGTYEVPVDSDLATGVPLIFAGGRRYTVGGQPHGIGKSFGRFEMRNRGFPRCGHMDLDPSASVLAGTRRAAYEVQGRTVRVSEHMHFEHPPDAVAIQLAEAEHRPLRVTWDADVPFTSSVIETSGMKDYRSFWGELPRLHQIDVEPSAELTIEWTVTPKLRVASTAWDHHYHRSLYDPIAEWLHEGPASRSRAGEPEWWRHWDVLHLHWPEWFLGSDVGRNEKAVAAIRGADVRTVWTQHNLVPHSPDPAMAEIYSLWASVADVALHHTIWGMDEVMARYEFGPSCRHVVLPHGQFGNLIDDAPTRRRTEESLGLRPDVLRLGVVGAPRPTKDVQLVLDAVQACARQDLELVVLSLDGSESVPDDPRIHAEPYRFVARETYDRWLSVIDVLVLPFHGGELLTTGTVGDAVAWGLPSLTTDWAFLIEVLGDAAIVFGRTAEDLAAAIDGLSPDRLRGAAATSRALRDRYDWTRLGAQLHGVLDELVTPKL